MLNYAELENLKKRIKRYPSQYRQEYWGYGPKSFVVKDQKPICGTAGCLAFNVVANNGYTLSKFDIEGETAMCQKDGEFFFYIRHKAVEILGLTHDQSDELFGGGSGGWSSRARQAYNTAKTPRQRAAAAVMAIDDFIAKYRAIEAYGTDLKSALYALGY